MKKLLLTFVILALLFPSASPALAGEKEPSAPTSTLADESTLNAPAPLWQELFPPTSPPPRADHAMAYDTDRDGGILFGGINNAGAVLDDTWEWDSATMTWTDRQPAHRPLPRFGHAMVYDPARGVTLLFGGVNAIYQEYNDTWEWDGTDWIQVFPASSPAPRWLHGMVYDIQRQVIVLFGGLENARPYGETWEWEGSNWTEQVIINPSIRFGMAMAYDARREVTVLFGGDESIGFQFLDETWERAGGGNWHRVFPTQRPEARERMASAYFPRLRRVVIFGGLTPSNFLDDTWFWNGQRWQIKAFDPRPDGFAPVMVYDALLRGMLLLNGSSETWLFR